MTPQKHTYYDLKPLLMGATAFFTAACSSNSYEPVIKSTAQYNTKTQTPAPNQKGVLKGIADELASAGDHKAAIPIYRHLASRDGNPQALNGLATSLLAQGLQDAAFDTLTMLVTRGQATGQTWYNLGKVHLARGQFEKAVLSFSNAIMHEPDNTRFLSGKAVALAATGDNGAALMLLTGADDILAVSNKALILAATGKSAQAVSLLEPIIRTGHGSARDRQNLTMAYLLNGQEDEAHRLARLDLDSVTTNETLTFYRSLMSLGTTERMQALITGVIKPEWDRSKKANFTVKDNKSLTIAAKRITTPEPAQEVAKNDRQNYVLKEIPPLVEPEGWALQIGAYRSIKNLMRGWTILYRQSGDILKDIPPRRSEVNFGEKDKGPKGFYYRLNAGPLKTFKQANDLCKELRARGTSCWIRPPETSEGKLPTKTAPSPKPSPAATTADKGKEADVRMAKANIL